MRFSNRGFNRCLPVSMITAAASLLATGALAAPSVDSIRLHAVTESHQLITVSAAAPGTVISSVALSGLRADEHILGIDYRVAYGALYALGSHGRIFKVDVSTGALTALGEPDAKTTFAIALEGERFGFDFNPAADRIRIVSDRGQNLRAHPETGALVDFSPDQAGLQPDAPLRAIDSDPAAGKAARIVAAAYTYNTRDEKLTTNFAIDAEAGTLVRQGSEEGEEPVVSPNTGLLTTIGPLGVADIVDAHFDISDVSNIALASFSTHQAATPTLYRIDLGSGKASPIGVIGNGEALRGVAIEP
jgi:hypothetical protein